MLESVRILYGPYYRGSSEIGKVGTLSLPSAQVHACKCSSGSWQCRKITLSYSASTYLSQLRGFEVMVTRLAC
jgi:hypothetical protein